MGFINFLLIHLVIGPALALETSQASAIDTVHSRAGAQSPSSDGSNLQQHDLNAAIDNEVWLARLDYALIAVHKSNAPHLRAVAQLGKGETDAELNRRRLEIVQDLIDSRGFKIQLLSVVGDPVPELGRIELYVEDQLFDVLTYLPGRIAAPYDADDPDLSPLDPRR